jgi:aminopeptidase N
VTDVALDLASPSNGKGMTVSQATSGGQPVRFAHDGSRLRLTLPARSTAAQETTFVVSYRGIPAAGLRIGPNKYGERTFFASSWPDKAHQWLPTIDHISDKATVEFIVTAPAHYQVVANGRLVEQVDLPDNVRRTHWSESIPISPWLCTIGVANFAVHHADAVRGVPLDTWVFPKDRDAGVPAFELPARQAIDFYSELVGPYLYEKLANVEAAGVNGGMEHASAISYGESSVNGRPVTTLVAHEVAHAWFGDGVTESDWDDVWLSEGFATYLTHMFVEHVEGHDAFVAGLARDRDRVIAAEKKVPDTPIIHRNLADMSQVLNTFVYQKAGWVLHMLRQRIGDENFRTGLREYFARFRNGTASTADFRRVMEGVSRDNLADFFSQWLTRPGVPAIDASWHYDATTKTVEMDIVQTQVAAPFRLPLDIGIAADSKSPVRVETVSLSDRKHHFSFAADREPSAIQLDPNTRALADMTVKKVAPSL